MTSTTVTPRSRVRGWNIHLLAGTERFAGLYHPPGSDTLRYRDMIDEIRLCFKLPLMASAPDLTNGWNGIAFGHLGDVNVDRGQPSPSPPSFVWGASLDLPVSAPERERSTDPMQCVSRYQVIRHDDCDLPVAEPLETHIRAGCATHIPFPSLRLDSRYLPPNKWSKDPNFAQLPHRRIRRLRGSSASSLKRSVSGFASSTRDSSGGSQAVSGDDDVASLIIPPVTMDMSAEDARQIMATFRTSCIVDCNRCAVSGKGRVWYPGSGIGPAVQACHIVPQQHYHTYPLPEPFGSEHKYSHRRLQEAWRRTWQARNGMLLSKTLHELFGLRLFSIHPDTLRVRIFVPYDFLEEYHGRAAQLTPDVDREALRHHYEMCCIENMAAEMPLREQILQSHTGAMSIASGGASALECNSHITSMSPESPRGNDELTSAQTGDPSKRQARQADDCADTPDAVSPYYASFSANEKSADTSDSDKYGSDDQAMLERGKRRIVARHSTYPLKQQRVSGREHDAWAGVVDNETLNDAQGARVFAPMPFSIERFLAERSNLTDDEETL